jgi:hypothetical protein
VWRITPCVAIIVVVIIAIVILWRSWATWREKVVVFVIAELLAGEEPLVDIALARNERLGLVLVEDAR